MVTDGGETQKLAAGERPRIGEDDCTMRIERAE